MKKLMTIGLLLAGTLALAADVFVETVSLSSGSAVASANGYTKQMAISCDGEVRYRVCPTSTCTATSDDAKLTNFDLPVDVCIDTVAAYVSLIRTGSSTVTCKLYKPSVITPPCK
jgi:hypothetical protein